MNAPASEPRYLLAVLSDVPLDVGGRVLLPPRPAIRRGPVAPAAEVRAKTADMVREISAETRQRLRQAKCRPLGVRRILRQDPHGRPQRVARSPAPRFHAATWQIRRMLEAGYRSYSDAYRDATRALQKHRIPVHFPNHGIPPPLNLVANRA